jgi:hypothetical protein
MHSRRSSTTDFQQLHRHEHHSDLTPTSHPFRLVSLHRLYFRQAPWALVRRLSRRMRAQAVVTKQVVARHCCIWHYYSIGPTYCTAFLGQRRGRILAVGLEGGEQRGLDRRQAEKRQQQEKQLRELVPH